MSVPTKEQIDYEVAQCRAMEVRFPVSLPDHTAVVCALADENDRLEALFQQVHGVHSSWVAQAEKHRLENDRLRAERDECVKLLERSSDALHEADELMQDDDCFEAEDQGFVPLRMEINATVAKLRTP